MLNAQEAGDIAVRRNFIAKHYGPEAAAYIYTHLAPEIESLAKEGVRTLTRRGISSNMEKEVVAALKALGYSVQAVQSDLHIEW